MKIYEMMNLPPLKNDDLSEKTQGQFDKEKDSSTLITTIGDIQIFESGSNDSSFKWFVVKYNEALGIVKFSKQVGISKSYYSSSFAWIDPSMRGKGVMKQVYRTFIQKYGELMSDYEQTEDSKRIWKSLFKEFNCYGNYWNENQELQWGKIESREELEKAWPPVDKYKRILLTVDEIDTGEK